MLTLISNGYPLEEISIKSLVGYLEYYDIPVQAIYLNQCGVLSERVKKQILSLTQQSKLIGFSVMSKDVCEFLPIITAIKKEQNIPVVLGGIHPTALPEESLNFADFVCIGEGEEPLRLLYNSLGQKKYDIPNIGYKVDGNIFINPTSYFVASLDDIPFPDYNFNNSFLLVKDKKSIERIPVEPVAKKNFLNSTGFLFYSQRGCRFACSYCSNSVYRQLARPSRSKWYRLASPERIKNELRAHIKSLPFIKHIALNDDDFLARDINELEEISVFIKKELSVSFTVNAIPSFITEEKVKLLTENGLIKISFGVQSGSKKILKEVYKRHVYGETVLSAAETVAKFYDKGVSADYGFILDNPYENDEDWRESLRLLISLPRPRSISLYSLTFFPGTALTNRALTEGLISSLSSEFNKRYHDDIKPSYANSLFFFNSRLNIPAWLNKMLLSDFIVQSKIPVLIRMAIICLFLLRKPALVAFRFFPKIIAILNKMMK